MRRKRLGGNENQISEPVVGIIENDRPFDVVRRPSDTVKTEQSLHEKPLKKHPSKSRDEGF